MAIAGKNVINTSTNERGFISAVYDYILALNLNGSTISCDTTIADQFDDATVEVPTFNFTITPNIVLQMIRPSDKTTSITGYTFNVIINDEQKATATIAFSDTARALTDAVERKWLIGYVASALNTFLWFGNYNVTVIADAGIAICSITDTNNYRYGAGNNNSDLESATYFRSGEVGVEYTMANLFNYDAGAGYIEYITHLSFINAGQEQFRTEEIVNCSEISQGRSVAIQPGNYFSVGSHTLIALD